MKVMWIYIGIAALLVLIALGVSAQSKKTAPDENAQFQQLVAGINQQLQAIFSRHGAFHYSLGYRDGYIAGAIDCAEITNKLEKEDI